MGDLLFAVRNNFYLGAFNNVLNEASDLESLSEAEQIERDCYVYRSYIAQGSYEVWVVDACWLGFNHLESPAPSTLSRPALCPAAGDQ